MEDVVHLGDEVAALGAGALDKVLARYEEVRLPRTIRQLTARPWGQAWHTADPLTVTLRNRMLRARQADDFNDVDWLYAEAH